MQKTKIETQVMASVGVVYATRQLTSAFALKLYALLGSLGGVAAFVSLPHVVANLLQVQSNGLAGVSAFLLSAVLGTKLVVQLALLVGAVVGVSLMIDTLRSLGTAQPRAFAA